MNIQFDRVLVVAPHTDDEFGCAGATIRLIENGAEVHYYALSACEESVPEGFPKDILRNECMACTKQIGIESSKVIIGNYRVRYFPKERQKILEDFVKLNRKIKPDLVLLPSSYDTHQDHSTVSQEGFRAFKYSNLLGYELPQNLISFNNAAFISLNRKHLNQKIEALANYKSQNFRNYSKTEFLESLAKVRGVQCNVEFAESFEVIRLIIK
jgi:LmbE family N-acetylglucosaminyl deacetylase